MELKRKKKDKKNGTYSFRIPVSFFEEDFFHGASSGSKGRGPCTGKSENSSLDNCGVASSTSTWSSFSRATTLLELKVIKQ